MLVAPSNARQGVTRRQLRREAVMRWARRAAVGAAALLSAVALALVGGFGWFVTRIPVDEVALDRSAEGIVVLTGGAERISDALQLLATGRGKRLLISGVHRSTNLNEIARRAPAYERLIACCVDLGHAAVNTVGNAVETRQWAAGHGFHSLIVVTSNYHMPRTMAELTRKLPGVALIPFPVISEKLRLERWWSSPMTTRLLLAEYVKYILALLRIRIDRPVAVSGASASLAAG